MNVHIQDTLQTKAAEISDHLSSLNLLCSYTLLEYSINFRLIHEGRQVVLTLSYSPKRDRWTPHSNDSWVKDTIIPSIQGLLVQEKAPATLQPMNTIPSSSHAIVYFTEAIECFRILKPFAEEYIDFSIICEYTKEGIRRVLKDPQ